MKKKLLIGLVCLLLVCGCKDVKLTDGKNAIVTFKEGGIRYNENYITSQDIALWFDVLCAGYKLTSIEDVTYYLEQADIISRRSRKKAWNEFKIYINGIYRMKGLFTMSYSYPVARLLFRLIPKWMVKMIYGSSVRTKFLGGA